MTGRVDVAAPEAVPAGIVLEARGLTKHFPVRRRGREALTRKARVVHAVEEVDLTLRRGRVTALVGESGSGKSTVARLLAQLYPRTGGDILLHGESTPLSTAKVGRRFRAYSRRVQMIFQDPFASLNPVHTVRYHLTRALHVHRQLSHRQLSHRKLGHRQLSHRKLGHSKLGHGWPGARRLGWGRLRSGRAAQRREELEAALAALLGRVQLTPPERYLGKFPHELSGGQRQRVAIARALAADPDVLLADEPVSMLDVSIRLGVLNLLRELKERLNLAILYITHDIASARYFADETLVMYAGRLVEGGDSETVTQQAAHPYTRLLVSSAPDPDRLAAGSEQADQQGATGEPPSLITPPTGCRFHPRCPYVMDECRTEVPPRFDVGGADVGGERHWAACWLFKQAAA